MDINLVNEIKKIIFLKEGNVKEITYDNSHSYIYKGYGEYAVAIPYDYEKEISEEFVGITLSTNILYFEDESVKVLYLHAVDTIDLEKFSYVGSQFIDNRYRDSIIQNPFDWVDEWKQIFGDSIRKKMIYDVIGELISLKYIYSNDKSAVWEGPNKGTHDIVCQDMLYEVKSSTKKYESIITINSAFQISNNKSEKLFFCRLEIKPFSHSINSLVDEIIKLGYDENELEDALIRLGYKRGSRLRTVCYDVLNINSYDINQENFPIIPLEKINNFAPRNNIVNYKITLDLTGLPYKSII